MPLYGGIVQSKSCFFSPSSASENSIARACLQSSSDAAFRKSRIEEWRGSMVSLQTRPSKSIQLNSSAVIARVIAASAKELDFRFCCAVLAQVVCGIAPAVVHGLRLKAILLHIRKPQSKVD